MQSRTLLVVVGVLCGSVGCSMHRKPAPLATAVPYREGEMRYDGGSVPALVFDPPVIADEAPLYLARADRAPAAFGGFEEVTTTYSYLRIEDRHTGDGRERYERRAIIERIGVSHR